MLILKRANKFCSTTTSLLAIPALAFGAYSLLHSTNRTLRIPKSNYSTMSATMSATLVPPQAAPSWKYSPEDILQLTNETIASTSALHDALAGVENPTVESLIKPFLEHENTTQPLINQLTFLQHVSADKEVRDASTKATELLQDFEIEASLRHDLFVQFDKVWQACKDDAKFKKEHFELYKFVEKCHKDYVRAGLNLPEEKRNKVKELQKKMSNNSLQFSKNLGEQKEFVAFTTEELDGVSASVMDQFEKFTDTDGVEKHKVTFKYPDILPVLKTAKNPETRKRAFGGDQNKVPQNEVLFLETLRLRDELAGLLGYSTYANYNLDIKMAKKQETVLAFLEDLKNKLKPLGVKEIEALKSLKEKDCKEFAIPFDNHYYIWDNRYYDNKYLKENYNVDEEKISEYFPLEPTIGGMLKIYETVLKLKFVEETDAEKKQVWHEDVKQLAVWKVDKAESPEFVGWIYFDLHPRDGKYGHAANFGIASSYVRDGARSHPVTALVCNFSKPSAKKPALLKHSEITTFFHELGHGIHDLVGGNHIGRFNGPGATPWDFVEAPSQMLEFWTWNKNELSTLSQHYETGEKIPEQLLDSLIATKHVNGALFALRQLTFGLFDMTVHTCKDLENLDVTSLWNDLRQEVSLVENGDQVTKGFNSFGHIMSGAYSAGYYGYMWAEVFAADMYHTKFAADPLNGDVGVRYRDIVLSRGGLYEIDDNLREFLGREPNNEAFLRELGLS